MVRLLGVKGVGVSGKEQGFGGFGFRVCKP